MSDTAPEVTADVAAEVEQATGDGFPVTVQLPPGTYPDGTLRLTYGGRRGEHRYTVTRGRTSASNAARLAELVALGGRPV